jgi:SAM-dependent methyltransferase
VSGDRPEARIVGAPEFYDRLADGYDEQFAAPHRQAYDELAWAAVAADLPRAARVVDVGCGVGRWAERFLEAGHEVVGFDPSPLMVERARARGLGPTFRVEQGGVDDIDLTGHDADLVVAMGSIQYADDPMAAIVRMAGWLRPGGTLAVLCDSLVALVMELLADNRVEEALDRARTGEAEYALDGLVVRHRLMDAAMLRQAYAAAGLTGVDVQGLLVSWTALGRRALVHRLSNDHNGTLTVERELAACTRVADAGKQLLALGRRPAA